MSTLAERVIAAVAAANESAAPFVPSHAEVVQQLQPIIEDIASMPLRDIPAYFRTQGVRAGTWDVYVLREVKRIIGWCSTDLGKLP